MLSVSRLLHTVDSTPQVPSSTRSGRFLRLLRGFLRRLHRRQLIAQRLDRVLPGLPDHRRQLPFGLSKGVRLRIHRRDARGSVNASTRIPLSVTHAARGMHADADLGRKAMFVSMIGQGTLDRTSRGEG